MCTLYEAHMVIVDTRLNELDLAGTPIRIGLIGAGAMGRMAALQLLTPVPGMRLAVIANRTIAQASRAFRDAGIDELQTVESSRQLNEAIRCNRAAVTEDALLVCASESIDIIVEATGTVDFGASVAMKAIEHGKHVLLMNSELDATLGPVLKMHADRAGIIISSVDGSGAGAAMNLVRYVRSLGLTAVGAGMLTGTFDPYSTPATQLALAEQLGQHPAMAASFADGTKLAIDAAILANATGFGTGTRGMFGPRCMHIKEIVALLPSDRLLNGGLVDYAVCGEPVAGAFAIVHETHPVKKQYLARMKSGSGPFYVFYTPHRLPHMQLASSVGRAVLCSDATAAPRGAQVCDVIAVTKRHLREGEILDGVGGYACYGTVENAAAVRAERLVPLGLIEGCRLKRKVARDTPLRYDDIEPPPHRVCDRLRAEQDALCTDASASADDRRHDL